MLDITRSGPYTRMSPEDPNCPIINEEKVAYHLGGAANVAYWLAKGTSHEVKLFCFWNGNGVNTDLIFRHLCEKEQITLYHGLDSPNVRKQAVSVKERICVLTPSGKHIRQLARVDRDISLTPTRAQLDSVQAYFADAEYDAIVIADYAKGVFRGPHGREMSALFTQGKANGYLIVNSKEPDRWADNAIDFLIYNQSEGEKAWPGLKIEERHQKTEARYSIMTRGAEGVNLAPGDRSYRSLAKQVVDVTGAGDAFTAGIAARLVLGEISEPDFLVEYGQRWARSCCLQIGCGEPGGERI